MTVNRRNDEVNMRKHSVFAFLAVAAALQFFFVSCKKTSDLAEGWLEVSGHIEAIQTEIRSQVSGKVTAIHVKEGQYVEAGDLLCEIDSQKIFLLQPYLEK